MSSDNDLYNHQILNYCPNCGQELVNNPNFCPKCGNQFKIVDFKQNTHNTQELSIPKRNEFLLLPLYLFIGWLIFIIIGATLSEYHPYLFEEISTISFIILSFIVFISMFPVYSDAKTLNSGEKWGGSPRFWAITVFLFWLLMYPLYLCSRKIIWEKNNF